VDRLSPVILLKSTLWDKWPSEQDPQLWRMLKCTIALKLTPKKQLFDGKEQLLNTVRSLTVLSIMDTVGAFTSNLPLTFFLEITSYSISDQLESIFQTLKMLLLITT